ncbi:DUF2004 domain-containing protein [Chitinibacter sp. SCUT-21]|uniref:DUF2004 domain-containing protein n=1 Tax=Chitinibacter sp. SCUT-21 TaxID=2970891 RepID=UPI0035A60E04
MQLADFPEFDPAELEECYESTVQLHGHEVNIDLNFDSDSIEGEALQQLQACLASLEQYPAKVMAAIADDFDLEEDEGAARFYLQHHLEQFSEEELQAIFGATDIDKSAFMAAIQLTRIGVYPDESEYFMVCDVQFPEEYTNYLLAVTFDQEGELVSIDMES